MQGKVQLRVMLVVMGTLAATATVWLSVASATKPDKPPLAVSPAAVLTWNTYTVNAVRASLPTQVPDRRHGLHVVRGGGGV